MRSKLLHLILIILVAFLTPAIAFSQELKICEDGLNKCQVFIKDGEKYKTCIKQICSKMYNAEELQVEQTKKNIQENLAKLAEPPADPRPLVEVTTCEYGLRKCDALKNQSEYYWECISVECKNPEPNFVASCKEGHFICTPEMEQYQTCLGFECLKIAGSSSRGQECAAGKQVCRNDFDYFWHCVYAICLGPVEHYKKEAPTRKYIITQDKAGNKSRVILDKNSKYEIPAEKKLGDFFLNKGFDYREFRSAPPQKYMSVGNPSEDMQCLSGGMLRCKDSTDLRSCMCSDGSMPIFTGGMPNPIFDKN